METIIIYLVSGFVIGWIIKRACKKSERKKEEEWQILFEKAKKELREEGNK